MTSYAITADCSADRFTQVGPLIPGAWSRHDDELGRELRGEFLIDTGAYGAMIDLDVADALQLSLQGAREVHGIHGYGTLRQFVGRIALPALDELGGRTIFTEVIECVGVPALCEKNRQHGVKVIGILGRLFLRSANLQIDGLTGTIELRIDGQ